MIDKNRNKINACQVSVNEREGASVSGKAEFFLLGKTLDKLSESHVMTNKI